MTTPASSDASAPIESASPAHGGSPYAVKLSVFEGPLDLLLHLIRLDEVEVTDIPIARIGEQYLRGPDRDHRQRSRSQYGCT